MYDIIDQYSFRNRPIRDMSSTGPMVGQDLPVRDFLSSLASAKTIWAVRLRWPTQKWKTVNNLKTPVSLFKPRDPPIMM